MTPEQIKAAYPFYNVDDIVSGSINLVDEGYWDATPCLIGGASLPANVVSNTSKTKSSLITKNAAGTRVRKRHAAIW